MNERFEIPAVTSEALARMEEHIRWRLAGRVHDLRLVARDHGIVLRGRAATYYAKQLAQEAVMETTNLPIRANEIEVTCAREPKLT